MLKEPCKQLDMDYLWLFCQFAFYTLTRPVTELRLLKVESLDMHQDRIYVPGRDAKGGTGKWIDMYPPLKDLILEYNIFIRLRVDITCSAGNKGRGLSQLERVIFTKNT